MTKPNRIRNPSLLVIMGFLLTLAFSCKKSEDPAPSGIQTVNFGALLDLTVYNPENGLATKAAIQFALDDLNSYAATAGRNVKFTCSFADTKMDTNEAKNLMKSMYSQGTSMFVASPFSSSELKALTPFANQNPIAVINASSTAVGMNHAGSHIFRILTDDSFQSKALIRAAVTEGVKAIIPVVRNDIWGNSLLQGFSTGFSAEGGYIYPGAAYDPSETSFTSLANTINLQVAQAIAAYGANNVAVLALTYGEITGIMTSAIPFEALGLVKWYGCDGNAQLKTVISENTLAAFALKTNFMSPMIGIGTAFYTPVFAELLSSKIALLTGVVPGAFALSAYDATYIMGLAFLNVGSADMGRITEMIPLVCNSYAQMGISRRLNANNDLSQADYIFWKALSGQDGYYWDQFATYIYATDKFKYRVQ
ncbi:MAG: ABC transporter substrate-binding protein [Bacteroidetes bacterium]|nr:ABC transporter substrate-binding protein [Bacteroidota bacterium]